MQNKVIGVKILLDLDVREQIIRDFQTQVELFNEHIGKAEKQRINEDTAYLKPMNKAAVIQQEILLNSKPVKEGKVKDLLASINTGLALYDIETNTLVTINTLNEQMMMHDAVLIKPFSLDISLEDNRKYQTLQAQLNCEEMNERLEALAELVSMEKAGLIPKPFARNMFMHCHTDHSFSPFKTAEFMYLAYRLGVKNPGPVDHDSIEAFLEAIYASKLLQVKPVLGLEVRVQADGEFANIEINSPGTPGEIYMAIHGGVEDLQKFNKLDEKALQIIRTAKIDRFIKTIEGLKTIAPELEDITINDVLALTPSNNPTEQHLAQAIYFAARKAWGNGDEFYLKLAECLSIVQQASNTVNSLLSLEEVTEETIVKKVVALKALGYDQSKDEDEVTDNYRTLIRGELVKPLRYIFPATDKEVFPIDEMIKVIKEVGLENNIYILFLGAEKCEGEKQENQARLMDYYERKGFKKVCIMANRNSSAELKRVVNELFVPRFGKDEVHNGMDVNKKGMPFVYFEYSSDPQFVANAERLANGK